MTIVEDIAAQRATLCTALEATEAALAGMDEAGMIQALRSAQRVLRSLAATLDRAERMRRQASNSAITESVAKKTARRARIPLS